MYKHVSVKGPPNFTDF